MSYNTTDACYIAVQRDLLWPDRGAIADVEKTAGRLAMPHHDAHAYICVAGELLRSKKRTPLASQEGGPLH